MPAASGRELRRALLVGVPILAAAAWLVVSRCAPPSADKSASAAVAGAREPKAGRPGDSRQSSPAARTSDTENLSGVIDPAYPTWPPLKRAEYLEQARTLTDSRRTLFLKAAYRSEEDPAMRIEIIAYFEELPPTPQELELLTRLVQTEPDSGVREAILMTAATHGRQGEAIIKAALRDAEEDVSVLAGELLDEMEERSEK